LVLVLGAEGKGLRPLVKKTCDLHLRLPTSETFSTLNVSNAAAVALYACRAAMPQESA
jgi:23S rRNA (guanosine2251-2'-O)-methyltransferase